MRFLIQKVKCLKIYQDQKLILDLTKEDFCYLIYVGIEKGDEKKNLEEIAKNLENLQIIDANEKFSQTLRDIKPKIVFISQITLLADFDKGRINFNNSLDFNLAKEIFEKFVEKWHNLGYDVFKTNFGSYLEIEATNIGPVNFYLNL